MLDFLDLDFANLTEERLPGLGLVMISPDVIYLDLDKSPDFRQPSGILFLDLEVQTGLFQSVWTALPLSQKLLNKHLSNVPELIPGNCF